MTPRPYISRYQLLLWETNKPRYMEEYFGDVRKFKNAGMRLGSEIADAKERGEDTGDFTKDFVLAQLPRYEIVDEAIICEAPGMPPVLIKPDTMKADWSIVAEDKTGSTNTPWTQRRVDEDPQLTFYATGVHMMKGILPAIELYWAPTVKDEFGRPELTGEVLRFRTTRTLKDVLLMRARIRKAWAEINEACDALLA